MIFLNAYTVIGLIGVVTSRIGVVSVEGHKTGLLFNNPVGGGTHQNNIYNQNGYSGLDGESRFGQTTSSPNQNGVGQADSPHGAQDLKRQDFKTDSSLNNVNSSEKVDQPGKEVSKQELSKAAYKLQDEVKSIEESKDKLQEIEKKEQVLSEKLRDTNYEKLNELVKRRNVLVNKIAAVGKTLRKEHDNLRPELKDQPILIIAKNSDDDKRKANQLAHLEGFEDFMNHITSPCNMMEELRQKSNETNKSNFKNKFETEQKILDSMSLKERLNYDRNMIEHYESIMAEIEQGIKNAEDEINKSWNHLEE